MGTPIGMDVGVDFYPFGLQVQVWVWDSTLECWSLCLPLAGNMPVAILYYCHSFPWRPHPNSLCVAVQLCFADELRATGELCTGDLQAPTSLHSS